MHSMRFLFFFLLNQRIIHTSFSCCLYLRYCFGFMFDVDYDLWSYTGIVNFELHKLTSCALNSDQTLHREYLLTCTEQKYAQESLLCSKSKEEIQRYLLDFYYISTEVPSTLLQWILYLIARSWIVPVD